MVAWPNGWVFIYELSGWEFQFRFNHLNFRYQEFLDILAILHISEVATGGATKSFCKILREHLWTTASDVCDLKGLS